MSDAAATPRTMQRVRFRENQVLAAADLGTHQRALRKDRWRHNCEVHGFGIVAGLKLVKSELKLDTGDGRLIVCAGLAYDQRGRELIIAEPQEIVAKQLNQVIASLAKADRPLDLWLLHHETLVPDPDGNGARIVEGTRIHYAAHNAIPASDPLSVGVAGVFLGSVPDATDPDRNERVYVRAVAARITAPSGLGQVLLAPETAGDPRRFAVSVAPRLDTPRVERLAVDVDGRARMAGSVMVAGPDSKNTAGFVYVGPTNPASNTAPQPTGVRFIGSAPAPETARPWQVYLAAVTDQQTKVTTEELRFEIANPGKQGSPPNNRFVVGTATPENVQCPFTPALTVSADGVVSLKGFLIVGSGGVFVKEAGPPSGNDGTVGGAAGAGSAAGGGFQFPVTDWLKIDTVSGKLIDLGGGIFKYDTTVKFHNAGPVAVTNVKTVIRVVAPVPAGQAADNPDPAIVLLPTPLDPRATATLNGLPKVPGTNKPAQLTVSVVVMGSAPGTSGVIAAGAFELST